MPGQMLCFMDKWHCDSWHLLKMVPGPALKRWSKSGQQQLRYCSYGQMLSVQMSQLQLESYQDGPSYLPLKFGQNRASNS